MAATPKTSIDDSTDLDEAIFNLYVRGGKLQVKINYCRLTFTAAGNTVAVDAGVDSDGEIVTGDLAWNGGNTEIDVTLSGFSANPCGFTQIRLNSSTNVSDVLVITQSANQVSLRFVNPPGDTAVDPDDDLQLFLLVVGA